MGIIPARAGFTTPPRRRIRRPRDHPRSCGVYLQFGRLQIQIPGSSPLVRGLPVSATVLILFSWIIPARAGFTPSATAVVIALGDHPRSCGVYGVPEKPGVMVRGSSPLVRGLLAIRTALSAASRIIPARAGFTRYRSPRRRPSPDHPRSCGVYRNEIMSNLPRKGSSPLVRGLLATIKTHGLRKGIIPARAGFTS